MKPIIAAAALLGLFACSQPATTAVESVAPVHASAAPVAPDLPAGEYKLDKSHASLTFRVNHLGFSNYTAQFKAFDAKLTLDPTNPTVSQLTATVDPRSLELPAPPKGFLNELLGPSWLDAKQFPQITFVSTGIAMTAPETASITGDLTLHGVTKPITLTAKFNGGYAGNSFDPNARVGFSAHGVFKRSDFGVSYGVPAPGTTMGVFDDVDVAIESEFTGPAWKGPPSATPPQ